MTKATAIANNDSIIAEYRIRESVSNIDLNAAIQKCKDTLAE